MAWVMKMGRFLIFKGKLLEEEKVKKKMEQRKKNLL